MIPLAVLLPVFFAHLAAAISPGPAVIMAMRLAASQGFLPGVGFAFGVGVGAAIWAAAALMGLTVLFQLLPGLFWGLKLLGAAFLIFIGIMTFRHAADPLPAPQDIRPMGLLRAARFGIFTQLINPKTAVFFGAVFVTVVPPGLPLTAIALILAMICAVEFIWVSLVARVFSLPPARLAYTRVKARVERVFGSFLAGFGVKLALS